MQTARTFFDSVLHIGITTAIGCLLGYGIAWAISHGYFQTWRRLTAPPIKAVEIIVADFGGVYINTASGTTYRSAPATEAGWVQADLPKSKSSIVANTKPCNLTSPEFTLFASPPTSVADCLQTIVPGADGATYATYALEPDGTLWRWTYTGNGYSAFALGIGLSAFGAFIGLLVGIIWSSRSK